MLSRYEKTLRELREKEESLAKARLDLKAELQASESSTPEFAATISLLGSPTAAVSPDSGLGPATRTPDGASSRPTSMPRADVRADADAARGRMGSDVVAADLMGARRDGPWMLETLGLSQVRRDFECSGQLSPAPRHRERLIISFAASFPRVSVP